MIGLFLAAILSRPADPVQDLADSAALWREMGMPVPGADAEPVWVPSGISNSDGTVEPPSIGFSFGNGAWVLLGGTVYPANHLSVTKADWSISTAAKLRKTASLNAGGFDEPVQASAAVVSEILGHRDFALKLSGKVFPVGGFGGTEIGLPKDGRLLSATAYTIAAHLANEMVDPKVDRRAVLPLAQKLRAKALLGSGSPLSGNCDFDHLCADLEQTVKAHPVKPGSAEAAVEALLEQRTDELEKPVWDLGLDAIPALAEHLDDHRLTRTFLDAVEHMPARIERMDVVVHGLIREITDEAFLDGPTKAQLLEWYAKKREGRTDEYYLQHLVSYDVDQEGHQTPTADGDTFTVIAKQFPKLFPEAFRRVLAERPAVELWQALFALSRVGLPDRQKRSLLLEAMASPDSGQRASALPYLQGYDRAEFNRLLLTELRQMPKDFGKADGAWELAVCAAWSDDDRCWSALEAAVRRADPALRASLLASEMADGRTGFSKNARFREKDVLRLLARYFDDATPCKPFEDYGVQTVGQAAMFSAGQALDPNSFHMPSTEAGWDALRRDLRARISRG